MNAHEYLARVRAFACVYDFFSTVSEVGMCAVYVRELGEELRFLMNKMRRPRETEVIAEGVIAVTRAKYRADGYDTPRGICRFAGGTLHVTWDFTS